MTANTTTILARQSAATTSYPEWSSLYRLGGLAALLVVVCLPIQIAVFILNPPPDTVVGWFRLFQSSRLIGLLDLDLLLMVDQVLTVLMFLALYTALRGTSQSILLIGTALGLFSTVLFIAGNPAFAMSSLSDAYRAAATEPQKTIVLAAGQATMSQWQGSAFQVSYLIGSIAAIVISMVMLRSRLFSKAAATMGILSNALALGLYVPRVGVYISVFSVVFLLAWYLLTGIRLLRLARITQTELA